MKNGEPYKRPSAQQASEKEDSLRLDLSLIIVSTKMGERDLVRFVQVLLNMENCIKRPLYIRTRFEKEEES